MASIKLLNVGKSYNNGFSENSALANVSFQIIGRGTVGIIGRNGAGKSTLLKIISGVIQPSVGMLEVDGKLAALLELGAGFNPEMTGRENLRLLAAIYGLSSKEIRAREPAIIEFSEIGTSIDKPIKWYSSGMFVRLAFSIIAHVDADIMIVDEALSVGDISFSQKCSKYFEEFCKSGILIFCSHSPDAVAKFADRTLLLDRGQPVFFGDTKMSINKYFELINLGHEIQSSTEILGLPRYSQQTSTELFDPRQEIYSSPGIAVEFKLAKQDNHQSGFGIGGASVIRCEVFDEKRRPLSYLIGGQLVTLEIEVFFSKSVKMPIIGFIVQNRLGQNIFGDNTYLTFRNSKFAVIPSDKLIATFTFQWPILAAGEYSLSPAVAEGTQESHVQLHWQQDGIILTVEKSPAVFGLFRQPINSITMEKLR